MPLIMLILLLVEKFLVLRDKLNVNFYEVGLRESLKKIVVLFKITHRISIQIYNLKNFIIYPFWKQHH